MNWRDYLEQVTKDAQDAINEALRYDNNRDNDELFDELFVDDTVTGNASGSYTFNSYKAAEYVAGVIWDCDAQDAIEMHCGLSEWPVSDGPEACDVVARCAALCEVWGDLCDYADELRGGDLDER